MTRITPQPGIMDIKLYESGAAHVAGVSNAVKLSSNENPLGPSDAAIEAYKRGAYNLHRYPSSDQGDLRRAIADVWSLDADRIICGAGSDEVIAFLCQAYAGPGDRGAATPNTAFGDVPDFNALGGRVRPRWKCVERERVTDVDAQCWRGAAAKTRLVFMANPNNPTGTMIGLRPSWRGWRTDCRPSRRILVLDGAYAEYVEGYDAGAAMP